MEAEEKRFDEFNEQQEREVKINYSNGEITVVWKPHLCIHAGLCFRGLPKVFNPLKRKWVDAEAAPSDKIIEQVNECPSGALSFFVNDKKEE